MKLEREKQLLAESKEALVRRIDQLESQVERLQLARDAAYEIAQEMGQRNLAIIEDSKQVKQRIKELEDPHDRHGNGLGWLGKMVQIIRQRNRPMRAQEIIHELKAMDNEGLLMLIDNPDNFLSGVLSKGKKAGRLKSFKVAGTRGGYFALEDWVDEDGRLNSEMKAHLL